MFNRNKTQVTEDQRRVARKRPGHEIIIPSETSLTLGQKELQRLDKAVQRLFKADTAALAQEIARIECQKVRAIYLNHQAKEVLLETTADTLDGLYELDRLGQRHAARCPDREGEIAYIIETDIRRLADYPQDALDNFRRQTQAHPQRCTRYGDC